MSRNIIFVVMMVTTLQAQSPDLLWDGYNWLEIDRLTQEYPEFRLPMKRAYLRGFLNGKLYHFLQVDALDSNLADAVFRDYLDRFSVEELIRGTDQFYQDPANRYIPIISALMITSLGAIGLPDSTVASYTQACRDWVNYLTILTTEQVPVAVEGISMPSLPRSYQEVYSPPGFEEIRKWYNPDSLILP